MFLIKAKRLSVFDFKDPAECLRVSWAAKKQRYPKLSIRGWAQKMGVPPPLIIRTFLVGPTID